MAVIPGVTVGTKPGVLKPPTGSTAATLPEITEADPSMAVPTIALVGASGTGKTEQIRRLIKRLRASGKLTLVIDIENKTQVFAAERPLVMPISGPMAPGVPATATAKYQRLNALKDAIRAGKYREHNGMPIGAIAWDGVMEAGDIIKAHHFANMPISSSGEKNTFALYDKIGADQIDLLAAQKEAASAAAAAFGTAPVGIVVTCGEELKNGEFRPILPGNVAPIRFPYQFEMILRLAFEEGQYVAHTRPGEVYTPVIGRWTAKAPPIFDAKIVDPDLGDIFEKLVAYYQTTDRGTDGGGIA